MLQGKIKSLEQIYLFSMPVKEYQIVESFLGPALKDEVMKIMPVQKQTRAGQRTRFKVGGRRGHGGTGRELLWRGGGSGSRAGVGAGGARVCGKAGRCMRTCAVSKLTIHRPVAQAFVCVGDYNGHCGLGVKCAKEVG